ncbi:MAG: phosphotransferase [Sediminibacterium sp.]|nr:phosphotransferase [Sediminibacterium sp.]
MKELDLIRDAFKSYTSEIIADIKQVPQSGSDRIYFRVVTEQNSYIVTYSNNLKENRTFIYFAQHFNQKNLPTPKILWVHPEQHIYIQEDLGYSSLLDVLEQHGKTNSTYHLYQQSILQLIKIQVDGDQGLDYQQCLTNKEFGKQAIMADLLYFKYYFLDTLQYPYDKQNLLVDFEKLADSLIDNDLKYFLFRDFQSRNILIKNDQPYFIDFQGGMKGAVQYDLASLIWQAKADLPPSWKISLVDFYFENLQKKLQRPISKDKFMSQYNGYVLIRLLQVLGAYGFRGLFERKAHFLSSIPLALGNVKLWLESNTNEIANLAEFYKILQFVCSPEITQRFTFRQANAETALQIFVNSFSYKNNYPSAEHGGGYVFDLRGVLNPGRFEPYKFLSGKDSEVINFLEQETNINVFLNSAWDMIDINIQEYLKRDFSYLQINFGCTGGQHRSVYAAEQTARHIRNKYKIKVHLNHLNQEHWCKS